RRGRRVSGESTCARGADAEAADRWPRRHGDLRRSCAWVRGTLSGECGGAHGARRRNSEHRVARSERHVELLRGGGAVSGLLTIGHSTRTIEEFIEVLQSHGVQTLVDVRTVPKSRANPQFAGDALAASLSATGIEYRWMRELGGLRHARKDSVNTAWR